MKESIWKDSDSKVQLSIEKILISEFEKELKIYGLGNNDYLFFPGDDSAKIRPDIYSKEHHIIGEVYSHIGKLKSAQMHKVESDILKMILFEKDTGVEFDKYYLVCDKDTRECLLKNSVIKTAIRLNHLHIVKIELNESQRILLSETMKKQDLTFLQK